MNKVKGPEGLRQTIDTDSEESAVKENKKLKAEIDALMLSVKQIKKENKKLVGDIESMHHHVQLARQVNQMQRLVLPVKPIEGKSFNRLIIPDVHGSRMDRAVVACLLSDIDSIKPAQIIILGDFLECGGFLAQHHTLGYVAQTEYTYEEDVAAGNWLLDKIISKALKYNSNCEIFYLEGNHERRIEKWCVTQALKNTQDANFLMSLFGPKAVLNLDERGIKFIPQSDYFDDVAVPGTIRLGHCYMTHGISTAATAAKVHVQKFGGNIVFGHTHRRDAYTSYTVRAHGITGWGVGCLCERQPMWAHTNPTTWTHSYAVQVVNEDDTFMHVAVPIIDGKSMLRPFLGK